jgi:hypothetical protein
MKRRAQKTPKTSARRDPAPARSTVRPGTKGRRLLDGDDIDRSPLQLVEAHEFPRSVPPPADLGRRRIVSHPIDPRSERAPAVEPREAAPERDVDLLQEVAAPVGIRLIRPRETSELLAELSRSFLVKLILHIPLSR